MLHMTRPVKNAPFSPISVSGSNLNDRMMWDDIELRFRPLILVNNTTYFSLIHGIRLVNMA